ncbi:hypothetical protein ACP70R_018668 [Stipagrostis hirtigluma subsp. patula]
MDSRQKQQGSKVGKRSLIMPAYGGPRRLLFRIRRRGFSFEGSPSLLISNSLGVWSVGHCRYIYKTRYYRYCVLKKQLDPIRRDYCALEEKLQMSRWPEAEEAKALRHKLTDLYWSVMPDERKERAVRIYRERRIAARRRRNRRRLVLFAAPVVCMVVLGFMVLRLMLRGHYSDWANLCISSIYLIAVYLLDLAWHAY